MKREITIPDYLTVRQYIALQNIPETDSELEKALFIISTITDIDVEELRYWDLESVKQVNEMISKLVDVGNEFS